MLKTFISNLGEEERAVFLQGFKTVPYFLTLLNLMLTSVNGRLANLDAADPKMPLEYTRLRAERDLLLEMVQVVED